MKPFLLGICAATLCCSCATKNEPGVTATMLPTCVASVVRDSSTGKVTDVIPAAGCHSGGGPGSNLVLFVVGPGNARERLRENSEYITFGGGTTTCYGPPSPSPPRCVCTATPCP
jgi:hypothetical protein